MNPFDQRSPSWHPWCECKDEYDYKSLAESFISTTPNPEEGFWRKSAQTVFSELLKLTATEKSVSHLVKLLFHVPLPKLYSALHGTKAAAFLDISSEKTAGSIRTVAASFLECLEILQDTEEPFSIRDWVQNGKEGSWLFLTSMPSQRAALLPLLSTWFSIAMQSLLQTQPNSENRIWFVADELPSLNRLKDLEVCLTQSRKYGGCALLALQSPAQLELLYGRETASVIIGNCATRIAFAEHDPEIAARISKTFGNKEVKEHQEGISYGAHEMRDGVNLSFQNKTSPVVSATDIQSLDNHEAFVRLPGNIPITKIKLKYQAALQKT